MLLPRTKNKHNPDSLALMFCLSTICLHLMNEYYIVYIYLRNKLHSVSQYNLICIAC